ncbi:MAG: sxtJ [Symploca sp. SIO2D2]|nr:sxtJ [Symploca sp. SIO2D2]
MNMQITKLTTKELRQFGLVTGGFVAVLFGLILPWIWGHNFPLLPWIVGGVLCFLALLLPNSLRPIYHGWMKVAVVLAWINSRIILGAIFFIVVTPMALIMRLVGRDPMVRKFENELESYRLSCQKRTRASLEKPY